MQIFLKFVETKTIKTLLNDFERRSTRSLLPKLLKNEFLDSFTTKPRLLQSKSFKRHKHKKHFYTNIGYT